MKNVIQLSWIIAFALTIGCKSWEPLPPDTIVAPRQFFQDTDQAKELDASVKAATGDLSNAVTVEGRFTHTSKIYAEVFDEYTRDLRTTLQANYNTFVTSFNKADSREERTRYAKQAHQVLEAASLRTAQIRGIRLQVQAFNRQPSEAGLLDIGKTVRHLLAESKKANETDIPPERVPDGLTKIRDDILGNNRPELVMWTPSGSTSLDFKIKGGSEISDRVDLTPFLERSRKVKLMVDNVDIEGQQAFLCHFKSDVQGTIPSFDGNCQVNTNVNVAPGDVVAIRPPVEHEVGYYLAWRSKKMTREAFLNRYKNAKIRLQLVAD